MPDPFAAERWRLLSPHLDRGLELGGSERLAWLAELRAGDPALAADLEALLAEQEALRGEGFLEAGLPAQSSRSSLAGHVVGAYTLRSPIGQGGMGSVWLAERSDGRFAGVAAVKLLNASLLGAQGEERFRREGNILARLHHPHIAQLVDAGVSSLGHPYLVLEHVDGDPIDRWCDARQLTVAARIRLFLDVLAAVAHAHANLVVHRDIKPSNVLVARAGTTESGGQGSADGQVKLLDFGIAKLLAGDGDEAALTRDGQAALTPEFAAPEQFTGGHVTTATDVYALGVLLYVLLTGAHPVRTPSRSPAEFVMAVLESEPVRASDAVTATAGAGAADQTPAAVAARRATTPAGLRAQLSGDLDNIVGKALEKDPRQRYPSVAAMAEDLRRHLEHRPVSARADTLRYRAGKFLRRHRQGVAAASLVVLALAAGMVGTISQARRAQEQAARADAEAAEAREQRDFALRQLSRAEAINDLNAFLLSDAAPPGQPLTAGELLARAERIAERQQGDSVDTRVEVLVSIGRQRQVLDEHDAARRVLARAHQLAVTSADPTTRARASCALASAIAKNGEHERAEGLIRQAEVTLPRRPQYALDRIFCLMRGSEVAQERGDPEAGLARAAAAQRLLAEAPVASTVLGLRVAMKMAESYRLLGRERESAAAFAEAFARLRELGRDETDMAATLLNNWALTLGGLGRPLEAERLFRQAVEIGRAGGSDDDVSPMLLNNLARSLRDLGRVDEAAALAERAYSKARSAGHKTVVWQSLVLRTSIHRQAGDAERAAAMLAELEPMARRLLPPEHSVFAALALERALLAQLRGDHAAALAGADRALAIIEAGGERDLYVSIFLRRRAEIALAQGLWDRARADAEAALGGELQRVEPGSTSSTLGELYLLLGHALRGQGRADDARAAYTSAARHLAPTVGAEHALTRSARELAGGPAAAGGGG